MIDITKDIYTWLSCCSELWKEWFKCLENGEDEFLEVEEILFSSLVLSKLDLIERPRMGDCFKLMYVTYQKEINENRSICRMQKSGNIYCESKIIKCNKGEVFPIRQIDSLGTMLHGKAYVEVKLSDDEWVLEFMENIQIQIDI